MNRATNRAEVSRAMIPRVATLSLMTVVAFSGGSAGADEPPITSAPARGAKAGKDAGWFDPLPSAIAPEKLRKLPVDRLRKMLDNTNRRQESSLKLAERYETMAARERDPKRAIGELFPEHKPTDFDRVREWADDRPGGVPFTLERYGDIKARYYSHVAARYGQNAMVVRNEIQGR